MRIVEQLSSLANRHLSKESFRKLRETHQKLDRKLAPLRKKLYGTFDSAALIDHLQARIPPGTDVLMVHSSFNHMQPQFTDSPLVLVRALMKLTEQGMTVVMPAFYFGDPARGGAYKTFSENPRMDLRRTPSQMGLLTELFRRSPGVRYSAHPLYRVCAAGPLAEQLVAGAAPHASAFGSGSPFELMENHNALILGIGKSIDVITHVHYAEVLMGKDFPVPRSTPKPSIEITMVDGAAEIPHSLAGTGFQWRRDMARLRRIVDNKTLLEWTFHGVPLFAVQAQALTRCLVDAARKDLTLYEKP